MISVGVVCEGDDDEIFLKGMIQRVYMNKEVNPDGIEIDFKVFKVNNHILSKIRAAAINLSSSDIVVFMSDLVPGCNNCRSVINKIKSEHSRGDEAFPPICVFACVEPELEEWFLKERVSLAKYLKLTSSELTRIDQNARPKFRFRQLIQMSNKKYDTYLVPDQVVEVLTPIIGIEILKNVDRNFSKFIDDLTSAFRSHLSSSSSAMT